MALPGNYSTRTVTGTILDLHSGNPAEGFVKFTPQLTNTFLMDAGADTIIAPTPSLMMLDSNGQFSVILGTTDDPDIDPIGWTYKVEIVTGGAETQRTVYYISLPAGASPIDLADISPTVQVEAGVILVKSVNGVTPDASGNILLQGLLTVLNRNSTFETNANGWEGSGGAVARSTAQFFSGAASLLLTPTGGVAAEARTDLTADGSPSVVIGETYQASGWVMSPTGWATTVISIDWLNAADAVISTVSSSTVDLIVNRWTYLTVRGIAPALTVKARIRFRETGTPAAGDLLYIDEAILTVPVIGALDTLADVNAPTPADNDVLRFNTGTGNWENDAGLTTAETSITQLKTVDSMTVFTASGTWNKPAGIKGVWVRVVGGGGSAGGCAATIASENAEAGGGGGGEYAEKFIAVGTLGASETVTVGTGGTAATAGNNSGNGGVTSSFGAHLTAAGGSGGAGGANTTGTNLSAGGLGGTGGSGGGFRVAGDRGGAGRVIAGNAVRQNKGGASVLSGSVGGAAHPSTGLAGALYGGGSAGPASTPSNAAQASLAGAAGVVIVVDVY
jgi:hypothetical protein